MVPCGIILFGAFGWAFTFAHGILSMLVTGSRSKPAQTVQRGGGGGADAAGSVQKQFFLENLSNGERKSSLANYNKIETA